MSFIDLVEGATHLVKESGIGSPNEAWVYANLGGRVAAVAEPVAADINGAVVTLRYHDGAPCLQDVEHPIEFLFHYSRLAAAVAELHTQKVPNDAPPSPRLPRLAPAPYGVVETLGPAARKLLAEAQTMDGLVAADQLAAAVNGPNAIVHGDLKPDNVLLVDGRPLIIDWDLGGVGVIWTDLGAMLGSMIDSYARMIRRGEGGDLEPTVPIELIHGACQTVLDDYWQNRPKPADSRRIAYAHAALWLAWRVIIEASVAPRPTGMHRARLILANWVAGEVAEWGVDAA